METKVQPQPQYYKGRPVSAMGLRLLKIREQIDAAAERGEIKLLTDEELAQELAEMRRD